MSRVNFLHVPNQEKIAKLIRNNRITTKLSTRRFISLIPRIPRNSTLSDAFVSTYNFPVKFTAVGFTMNERKRMIKET